MGREHFWIDVSHLAPPRLSIFRRSCECWNKAESWISPLQFPQLINERGIFQAAVRVEQNNGMAKPLHRSVGNNAEEWCDADATRQEYGGPGCIVVKSKGPHWAFDPDLGTDRQDRQGPLKRSGSHAGGDHDLLGGGAARNGECMRELVGTHLRVT